MKKRTAGTWDPSNRHVIFAAMNPGHVIAADLNTDMLIAVNEMDCRSATVGDYVDWGRRVLLDSGIFNLTQTHARAHKVHMNEALALHPSEIDGFERLREAYIKIASEHGPRIWGYIELGQGGREAKKETRAGLEALGLGPIPVYHPLNDGFEYFDELASTYDRICLGNLVQADRRTRAKLMTAVLARKKEYPDLWIHCLGVSPVPMLMSLPFDSADASTWLWPMRWPKWPGHASMTRIGRFSDHFYYRFDDAGNEHGHDGGLRRIIGWDLTATERYWRIHIERCEEECRCRTIP